MEGALTAKQIFIQIKIHYPDPAPPPKVQRFFDANEKWEEEEKKSGRNAEYWEQRTNLDTQVQGIYDGYMSVASGRMVHSILGCSCLVECDQVPSHRGDVRV